MSDFLQETVQRRVDALHPHLGIVVAPIGDRDVQLTHRLAPDEAERVATYLGWEAGVPKALDAALDRLLPKIRRRTIHEGRWGRWVRGDASPWHASVVLVHPVALRLLVASGRSRAAIHRIRNDDALSGQILENHDLCHARKLTYEIGSTSLSIDTETGPVTLRLWPRPPETIASALTGLPLSAAIGLPASGWDDIDRASDECIIDDVEDDGLTLQIRIRPVAWMPYGVDQSAGPDAPHLRYPHIA